MEAAFPLGRPAARRPLDADGVHRGTPWHRATPSPSDANGIKSSSLGRPSHSAVTTPQDITPQHVMNHGSACHISEWFLPIMDLKRSYVAIRG